MFKVDLTKPLWRVIRFSLISFILVAGGWMWLIA